MKTSTTLFLSALTVCSAAQSPYRPFPESNAGWVEEHSWLNGWDDWTTCVRTVRFSNDTVIGGVTYHQLRSVGSCSWFNVFQSRWYGDFVEPEVGFAIFRQDMVARQVFVYDVQLQQEVLWFDFTLGLGDYPVTFNNQFTVNTVQVVALDSMELNDGYHRTWVLATQVNGLIQDSAYCTIIEGVGPTYGLDPVYGLAPPFEWSDVLTCHSANGVGIYPAGSPACYLSQSVAASKLVKEEVIAYPNPASSSVSITGVWPTNARYVLVDALGVEARSGSLYKSSIEVAGLGAGIYAIHIRILLGMISAQCGW